MIRLLYGRPLETLLATWGISLGLIQTVRLLFGAQNVAVANPDWLSGGFEIAHGLVLPYSRIAVVVFVVAGRRGRLVHPPADPLRASGARGDAEPRAWPPAWASPPARVDTYVFGLGSGIAGLGGVALSQLGNVGPELGQGYIIDSFMVVVLGGVGRLAGAVAAALGLGVVNKLLEPVAGAVLGKIVVLGVHHPVHPAPAAGPVRAQGPRRGLTRARHRLSEIHSPARLGLRSAAVAAG